MAAIRTVFLVSCIILVAYGFPMQIPPPKPIVERPKYTGVNPMERGGGFGGDMIIPNLNRNNQSRGVAVLPYRRWPNKVIPYDISPITDAADRQMITDAMQLLMYDTGSPIEGSTSRNPCVYFRPRVASDESFFTIRYGTGCNAHAGYWLSGATMTLQKDGCFHSRVIQHELMHVIGFDHEHQRADRDQYINVYLDNVQDDFKFALDKVAPNEWTNLNTPYDYYSIMHYGVDAFSKNGQPTMIPKQEGVQIGEYPRLTPTDILEVRRFYEC